MQIRIGDLKQYTYCPRILYWSYCLPVEKERTFKMEYGAQEHERISALEVRRSFRRYGIVVGKRYLHVPLNSERLGLSGLLDMLIIDADGFCYPVEFKHTEGPIYPNHRLQLAGYAMLLEERFGQEVRWGFVYRLPLEKVTRVPITPQRKRCLLEAVEQIRRMVAEERMPPPTPRRGRCVDCEFRRFCGDV